MISQAKLFSFLATATTVVGQSTGSSVDQNDNSMPIYIIFISIIAFCAGGGIAKSCLTLWNRRHQERLANVNRILDGLELDDIQTPDAQIHSVTFHS